MDLAQKIKEMKQDFKNYKKSIKREMSYDKKRLDKNQGIMNLTTGKIYRKSRVTHKSYEKDVSLTKYCYDYRRFLLKMLKLKYSVALGTLKYVKKNGYSSDNSNMLSLINQTVGDFDKIRSLSNTFYYQTLMRTIDKTVDIKEQFFSDDQFLNTLFKKKGVRCLVFCFRGISTFQTLFFHGL